jgi:hypothetical protein
MDIIINVVKLLFSLAIFALSQRWEYGTLNYRFSLNYAILTILGLEYFRDAIMSFGVLCCGELFYNQIATVALTLILYDSISVFSDVSYFIILLEKTTVVTLFYLFVVSLEIFVGVYVISVLVALNLITVLTVYFTHREPFRYGTIHQNYVYATVFFYIVYLVAINLLYRTDNSYELEHSLISIIFNYQFQLNTFYKLGSWNYNIFIRSGFWSRLLFVVDYYERPEPKLAVARAEGVAGRADG